MLLRPRAALSPLQIDAHRRRAVGDEHAVVLDRHLQPHEAVHHLRERAAGVLRHLDDGQSVLALERSTCVPPPQVDGAATVGEDIDVLRSATGLA